MSPYKLLYFSLTFFCVLNYQSSNVIKSAKTQNPLLDSINKYYDLSKKPSEKITQRLFYINKAARLAKKLKNDTLFVKIVSYKVHLHNKNKQIDSALYFSYKMLRLVENLADSLKGKTYYKLGVYYGKKQINDSAYYYYNLSKDIYIDLKDSTKAGKSLLNMAILQSDSGDYYGSDEIAIKALEFLKPPKNNKDIASTYNCLAVSSKRRKDYKEAIYWYNLAVNTSKDKINKITYLSNIANVYVKQGNYKKAIHKYDSIFKDTVLEQNLRTKAMILDNLIMAKWLMTGANNYEKDFKRALKIRLDEKDLLGQVASNAHLSSYFENTDLGKSIKYALKMYKLSTNLNSIDDRLEAIEKIIHSEKDPNKIKKYSELYIHLNDSIIDVRERYKNKFAKIKYDTEKNRTENFELKIKNAKNQLQLEKANKIKALYLFVGILIILSSIFIYFQLKSRHKKEKVQQVYATETRISKKVHDEVANDLYHTMTKLQSENTIKEEILDDLEQVYIKTRDISKENSAIDFRENFESILNDLLLSYKDGYVNVITQNLSNINWNTISELKKTAIYRVLQELMTNMKKHSKATIAVLTFSKKNNNILINYKDDGIGCIIKKRGGLQNAENRIQSVGGTIIFESENTNGFKATIKI